MADTKKKPAAKKPAAKKPAAKADKSTEGGYGVSYLAEKHGIAEATVRVKLRDAGVEKEGKSYSWSSQAAADKAWAAVGKKAA